MQWGSKRNATTVRVQKGRQHVMQVSMFSHEIQGSKPQSNPKRVLHDSCSYQLLRYILSASKKLFGRQRPNTWKAMLITSCWPMCGVAACFCWHCPIIDFLTSSCSPDHDCTFLTNNHACCWPSLAIGEEQLEVCAHGRLQTSKILGNITYSRSKHFRYQRFTSKAPFKDITAKCDQHQHCCWQQSDKAWVWCTKACCTFEHFADECWDHVMHVSHSGVRSKLALQEHYALEQTATNMAIVQSFKETLYPLTYI